MTGLPHGGWSCRLHTLSKGRQPCRLTTRKCRMCIAGSQRRHTQPHTTASTRTPEQPHSSEMAKMVFVSSVARLSVTCMQILASALCPAVGRTRARTPCSTRHNTAQAANSMHASQRSLGLSVVLPLCPHWPEHPKGTQKTLSGPWHVRSLAGLLTSQSSVLVDSASCVV